MTSKSLAAFDEAIRSKIFLSVDFFDTMVIRSVESPHEIFAILQTRLRRENVRGAAQFARIRASVEADLRRARAQAGGEPDAVRLDEIYVAVGAALGWAKGLVDFCRSLEFDTELKGLRVNPLFSDPLARVPVTLPCVVLSDTYFSNHDLLKFMNHLGLTRPSEGVITSSDIGSSKYCGTVFDWLHAKFPDVPSDAWLHVGDNEQSDIAAPASRGVRTLLVPKLESDLAALSDRSHTWPLGFNRSTRIATLAQKATRRETQDVWWSLGNQVLGPLQLGFLSWLQDQVQSDGVRSLYFLARDGQVSMEHLEELGGQHSCRIDYLFVSRRVLNFAAIQAVDSAALRLLGPGEDRLTGEDCLRRFGLTPESFRPVARNNGLNLGQPLTSRDSRRRFAEVLMSGAEHILDVAAAERTRLLRYLDSVGLTDESEIGVVDIGWHGSLQRSLGAILAQGGRDTHVTGYYLGLSRAAHSSEDTMRAWVSERTSPHLFRVLHDGNAELLEILYAADHNSVVGLSEELEPVFAETGESGIDLQSLRAGAVAFLREAKKTPGSRNFYRGEYLAPFLNVAARPSSLAVKTLGPVTHASGIGSPGDQGLRQLVPDLTLFDVFRPGPLRPSKLRRPHWSGGVASQKMLLLKSLWRLNSDVSG